MTQLAQNAIQQAVWQSRGVDVAQFAQNVSQQTAKAESREIGAIDCDENEIGDRYCVGKLVCARSERKQRRCARDGADCDQSRCRG